MIHHEVIQPQFLYFIFFPLSFYQLSIFFPLFIPFLLKFLSWQKVFPIDSHIVIEHRRVSVLFVSFIELTHLPLEGLFIKIRKVLRNQASKYSADFFQFLLVVREVKFVWTVSDSAVIQSSNFELLFWMLVLLRLFKIWRAWVK